jgi:hypothetical protein
MKEISKSFIWNTIKLIEKNQYTKFLDLHLGEYAIFKPRGKGYSIIYARHVLKPDYLINYHITTEIYSEKEFVLYGGNSLYSFDAQSPTPAWTYSTDAVYNIGGKRIFELLPDSIYFFPNNPILKVHPLIQILYTITIDNDRPESYKKIFYCDEDNSTTSS